MRGCASFDLASIFGPEGRSAIFAAVFAAKGAGRRKAGAPEDRAAAAGRLWDRMQRHMSAGGESASSSVSFGPALKILEEMAPVTEGAIIPLLQKIQGAYGYIPKDIVLDVARRTGLPASRMFGVATFYAQFRLKPGGRHTIRVCRGTACHVRGSKDLLDALMRRLGVEEGDTSDDGRFTIEAVACLGTCFLAPVIMVDGDYYGGMSPDKIDEVLCKYR